ncbi:6-phosphogluconolactonase, eukaryotic type [Marinobacterium lacunae]|uniref:6-phosphogluconolactonase n=1 Tax=Marinobacterium lacunae TaxID=1232683 RepID=A0A081FVU2_9GAMM|nr:6-phosphogluconolactonase [Marinobacterium lacunae]KEA62647.1 6-phosphogluconolactonase, eukaryotic type [Marinobacterium lacunae]
MNKLELHTELNQAIELKQFDQREALEAALCTRIGERLAESLERRGEAALVVSGGRTPAALFERLSRLPLAWSNVTVTLADERWVDEQHQDSNARTVRTHLLQNHAAQARFLPLVNEADTPHEGQAITEHALTQLPRVIDVVVLGMGEDGHTASFFPHAPELAQALDPKPASDCVAVTPPAAPWHRITLTLPRLLASREIIVHLCGESKLPVLQQALAVGPIAQMPIRAVLRQKKTPVAIYWAP